MEVVIIGAGVVGITTAWALNQRGYQVTVIEKQSQAALETSRANAGQRSYGHVSPWASPKLIRKTLPSLVKRQGPLKIQPLPTPITIHFLLSMWRAAYTPGLFQRNHEAMLQLAQFSRSQFLALEKTVKLDFDGHHGGMLKLASTESEKRELLDIAQTLQKLDIPCRWFDAAAARDQEPGLREDTPLVGGLHVPGDGSGDCHLFTQALARECEAAGVRFRYDTTVTHFKTSEDHLERIQVSGESGPEWIDGDLFVVCAGCASRELGLSLGVKWPIYPVKGYSLTARIENPDHAPISTLVDDRYSIAITRLGNRLRATGFAELTEFNRKIPDRRLAAIREGLESRFQGAVDWSKAESWTGFRPMTPDGPALLGKTFQDNVYVNSGHGTWGWTLSAGSAEVIARQIAGDPIPLNLQAFDPLRFSRK
ncbi:D-amino acid dehydrogenase [Saccharospirillum salsuginis]|uniref:D-amino acid dehydrogenase n=1 Tax=Saccharospirillum salsuginis TaxID=418750 RepID=A0A918KR79_9GAMM|nr:D-amino acid dehydrogenase [Saccharospirillum salsuginis]GGX72763.1 D-amino acid dehydrogenase [Saccharospirillum salsuginis]